MLDNAHANGEIITDHIYVRSICKKIYFYTFYSMFLLRICLFLWKVIILVCMASQTWAYPWTGSKWILLISVNLIFIKKAIYPHYLELNDINYNFEMRCYIIFATSTELLHLKWLSHSYNIFNIGQHTIQGLDWCLGYSLSVYCKGPLIRYKCTRVQSFPELLSVVNSLKVSTFRIRNANAMHSLCTEMKSLIK